MAAARTLFRKYWIILIILIWVIAWVNRDWLAGGPHSAAEDPAVETAQADPMAGAAPHGAGTASETPAVEPPAPVSEAGTREPAPSVPAPGAPEEDTTTREEAVASAAMPEAAHAFSPGVDRPRGAIPTEARPGRSPELAPAPTAAAPETAPAAAPDADPMPTAAPADAVPEMEPSRTVVPMQESADVTPRAQPESPRQTAPAETTVAPPVSRATELVTRARSVARSHGPRAGAAALAAGLRELPPDAPERADLFGELGNFHFSAGNFAAALAAYDSALRALPDEERATMLRRLGPTYERYHPAGRSHLDQFR
jgi:hypothetical protein